MPQPPQFSHQPIQLWPSLSTSTLQRGKFDRANTEANPPAPPQALDRRRDSHHRADNDRNRLGVCDDANVASLVENRYR